MREACQPDGADAVIEVCGVPDVIPVGLACCGRGAAVLGGLVDPDARVTIDANVISLRQSITLRGVHDCHPRPTWSRPSTS